MLNKISEPIKALIYLVLGFLILFVFNETIATLFFLLSLFLIVDGLIHVFQGLLEEGGIKDVFSGIISIVVGIFFIINTQLSIGILVYILAAKFLIEGISFLYNTYKDRKTREDIVTWLDIGKNLLLIIFAAWLIAQPLANLTQFFQLIGVYALVAGGIKLIRTFNQLKDQIRSLDPRQTIKQLKPYLVTGFSYATGYTIGTLIILLLLSLDLTILDRIESAQTIVGIMLIILLCVVHAIFAGGIGAYLVARFNMNVLDRKAFIIWNIVGVSIANILLIIPTIIVLFAVAFVGDSVFSLSQAVLLFTIVGALYGLISSTVHVYKHLSRSEAVQAVTYMAVGYTIGGALFGAALYNFFFQQQYNYESSEGLIWLIIGVFLLGFSGGTAVNRSLSFLRSKKSDKKIVKRSTGLSNFFSLIASSEWMSNNTAKRFIGLMVISIVLIGLLTSFILNKPDLNDELILQTVGTQWTEPETVEDATKEYLAKIRLEESRTQILTVSCNDGEVTISGELGTDFAPGYYPTPSCLTDYDPQIATDSAGYDHLFWVSDEVTDVNNVSREQKVIYESIYRSNGFSEPVIVAASDDIEYFAAGSNIVGNLQVLWIENGQTYLSYLPHYDCNDAEMSETFREALSKASEFHDDRIIPSCGNHFERILYTPNPSEEYSDLKARGDGVYTYVSELISNAQYEVLFTNMWYDQAVNNDSPGSYLSDGVGELYKKVKDNPENYPRGVSVKILLGNPPEFVLLDTRTQIWSVLEDLRSAGVQKMIDEEIGWRVEVANFAGALPHSHTKNMIVDGKTVVGAGFNVTYKHLPSSHPSDKGADVADMAIQATGPIAQMSMAAFDDLWDGADQKHCDNFYPTPEDSWMLTCEDKIAEVSHVPEVLRFYIPDEGGDSNILSLYRSYNYKEADGVVGNSLRNAKESIDTIQVNFTQKMICDLNVIVPVCDFNDNVEYIYSIMKAVDQNGAKVRIITKKEPIEGVENKIAIELFLDELKDRGLEDLVEIRYFNGDFHNKTTQIDGEFLIVGSQNFHYSAWGDGGLTEFNLATDNKEANDEFKRYFDYEWERSIPLDQE